jgi:hypothetical protein
MNSFLFMMALLQNTPSLPLCALFRPLVSFDPFSLSLSPFSDFHGIDISRNTQTRTAIFFKEEVLALNGRCLSEDMLYVDDDDDGLVDAAVTLPLRNGLSLMELATLMGGGGRLRNLSVVVAPPKKSSGRSVHSGAYRDCVNGVSSTTMGLASSMVQSGILSFVSII